MFTDLELECRPDEGIGESIDVESPPACSIGKKKAHPLIRNSTRMTHNPAEITREQEGEGEGV